MPNLNDTLGKISYNSQLLFMIYAFISVEAPLAECSSCPHAPRGGWAGREGRLTSGLRRLARRAGGQLSDGGTDWRCGMSWGLYSLSLVSLLRSGFCKH